MGRYSDLKRGPELAAGLAVYTTYLNQTQAQKKAAYAALNVNRVVATRVKKPIRVFGSSTLLVPLLVPQEAPAPDTTGSTAEQREADAALVTTLRSILTGRIEATPAATDFVVNIPKFRPAQLFLTRRSSTTAIPTTSRFTGREYNRRSTNTISSPFGKTTDTETEEAAIGAIMGAAALTAFTNAAAGNKYRIIKQATIIAST